MPAGVHLLGEAAYQRQLRARRKALGLCRLCSHKAATGKRTCFRHLLYLAAWNRAKRAA